MVAIGVPFVAVYAANRVIRTTCTVDMVPGVVSDLVPIASPPACDLLYQYIVLPGGAFLVEPDRQPGLFNVGDPVPSDKLAG